MTYRIFILIFITHLALADESTDRCWSSEVNPKTKKIYTNASDWSDDKNAWSQLPRPNLNPLKIYGAFKVYKKEESKANSFGNDKMAHCYIGCRISSTINFNTAIWLGWFKESIDISDCNLATHFELDDYLATEIGARAGLGISPSSKSSALQCENNCFNLIENL